MTGLTNSKWAIPALVATLLVVAIGCSGEPQVVYVEKEVIKEVPVEKVVVKEVVVRVTPAPVPQTTFTPHPTATPRSSTPPTPSARPVATPTPLSNDYYVVIEGIFIEYYADFPSHNIYLARKGGRFDDFTNPELLLSYLHGEGVVTREQKDTYFGGGYIRVDLDDISAALYKLLQSEGYHGMKKDFGLEEYELENLLYYFDESMLDSNDASGEASDDGYVRIRDGSLETVVTDAEGNTTRVRIDSVDVEEFLDYLLDQGKITVEQRDAYGDSHELTISLKDAADFFEWAETDSDLYVGIDREDVDYIREELLPLFSFGD